MSKTDESCMQLDMAPPLIGAYMELFCNACRIALLLKDVPRKLIAQVSVFCWQQTSTNTG